MQVVSPPRGLHRATQYAAKKTNSYKQELIKLAYIYKITNIQNGKVYIGKTMETPEKRFKEHCNEAHRQRSQNRPLYSAMNKYGIENFQVSTVEECNDSIVNEREAYWIEKYQSFKYGYNATFGGDGKHYLDYDLICAIYKELQNASEVARQLNISPDSVLKVIKERNFEVLSSSDIVKKTYGKQINMYSKNGEYIKTFSTLNDAAKYIMVEQNKVGDHRGLVTHIRAVANGKRNTAYGYKWQWS